ncbi:MAG: glycosyltransferase [Alphaproteobacteria bacterium]|nr:glycosyltransferase [Alphaproteobacteria bacterium]
MPFDKTVLQVIPELDAGGAERTTVEIADAIVRAGGRAIVATKGGRLAASVKAAGGEVVSMPVHSKNPAEILANRGRLLALIRRAGVDIAHVRSRAPAWSALWAARAAKIPLVATYHGAYRAQTPLKRFYNSAMVRADLVIANSEFTAQAIRDQYHVGPDRLRVIPRGVDLREFDPDRLDSARIARLCGAWGVEKGENAFVLLLPGRLTEWKGQEVAIDALARIIAGAGTGQPGNLQLILAGDAQGRDDYRAALLRGAEMRGVRAMVQAVGHCVDMPAAYALADAVLAPSTRPEAFGRVAVEAAAMGKVVIAADHGGARETIIPEETGFLAAPGDAAALAAAIAAARALGEAGRAAMGARARERARSSFSIEAMQRATLQAYQSLGA